MKLALVGGFLGAGKTTLLWRAAQRLTAKGREVGLVTNDQADGLVDTALLSEQGLNVREVTGSCFCCDFHGLTDAVQRLREEAQPDIILAEPVGSCADVVSTVVRPLKAAYGDDFTVCPFTVLADPVRLQNMEAEEDFHPDAAYIFRNQLKEADLIAVNKLDELDPSAAQRVEARLRERFPSRPVHWISALEGKGVDSWLETVLSGEDAGVHSVSLDYDRYAEGERQMGWLNARLDLSTDATRFSWARYCRDVMEALQGRMWERKTPVGHVKLLLSTDGGHCVANMTDRDSPVSVKGSLAGPSSGAGVTLNARAQCSPEELEEVVRDVLSEVRSEDVDCAWRECECFRPARPEPTYRQ